MYQRCMDTADHSPATYGEVLKFDLPGMLLGQPGTGVDGEFLWPVAPRALMTL